MFRVRGPPVMVTASCPSESDPRDRVAGFVSDPSSSSLGGLRTDGLQFLVDLVRDELGRQEPGSDVVDLDRDFLSDNGIDFARDLAAALDARTRSGRRVNWIVVQDLPIPDWQRSLEVLRGRDSQVYLFSTACRQVPCCFKLMNRRTRTVVRAGFSIGELGAYRP